MDRAPWLLCDAGPDVHRISTLTNTAHLQKWVLITGGGNNRSGSLLMLLSVML